MERSLPEIKLSVCIPTYNRARFIGETLQSIISQANENIEIIVVDGASTDNTCEVVEGFKKKFKNLFYYRGEKNAGVDRDMAKTIELSRGKYCWMLSDDDLLVPGAVKRILEEIKARYEIYLCNAIVCDLYMRPIRKRSWLSMKVSDSVFDFRDKKDLIDYCNNANSICAFFSYMSVIIFRRQEWNNAGYNYDFDGTAYALASSLLSFIKRKCRLKYIKNHLILWRNDNESFQNEGGLVKRFYLDFNGYIKLADKYLSDDSRVRDAFLKIMKREHPWYTIINVTSLINDSKLWGEFRGKLLEFGYKRRMVAICYALGRYRPLVSLGVKIKRKIIKSRRVNKVTEFLFYKRMFS